MSSSNMTSQTMRRRQSMRRDIVKQGYLKKLPNAAKVGASLKRPERRWFVFGVVGVGTDAEPYLEYYENEDKLFSNNPINMIMLDSCRYVIRNDTNTRYTNVFTLVLKDRHLNLVASRRNEMLDWCGAIESRLKYLGILQSGDNDYIEVPWSRPRPPTQSEFIPPPTAATATLGRNPTSPLPPPPSSPLPEPPVAPSSTLPQPSVENSDLFEEYTDAASVLAHQNSNSGIYENQQIIEWQTAGDNLALWPSTSGTVASVSVPSSPSVTTSATLRGSNLYSQTPGTLRPKGEGLRSTGSSSRASVPASSGGNSQLLQRARVTSAFSSSDTLASTESEESNQPTYSVPHKRSSATPHFLQGSDREDTAQGATNVVSSTVSNTVPDAVSNVWEYEVVNRASTPSSPSSPVPPAVPPHPPSSPLTSSKLPDLVTSPSLETTPKTETIKRETLNSPTKEIIPTSPFKSITLQALPPIPVDVVPNSDSAALKQNQSSPLSPEKSILSAVSNTHHQSSVRRESFDTDKSQDQAKTQSFITPPNSATPQRTFIPQSSGTPQKSVTPQSSATPQSSIAPQSSVEAPPLPPHPSSIPSRTMASGGNLIDLDDPLDSDEDTYEPVWDQTAVTMNPQELYSVPRPSPRPVNGANGATGAADTPEMPPILPPKTNQRSSALLSTVTATRSDSQSRSRSPGGSSGPVMQSATPPPYPPAQSPAVSSSSPSAGPGRGSPHVMLPAYSPTYPNFPQVGAEAFPPQQDPSLLSPKMREALGFGQGGSNSGVGGVSSDAVGGWNSPPADTLGAPPPYLPRGALERGANKSLKFSQVEQLQREMKNSGGVKVVLRRIDCYLTVAIVDCFNAVWIAGWNQQARPFLHNAFHIGDQLISINGQVVESARIAQKLIKQSGESDRVTFILRRTPHARVLALKRDMEGELLGLRRMGGTAEVVQVDPSGVAGRQGLPAKAPTVNGDNLCNWWITEVNMRPLNLFFKENEIEPRLNAVGKDISVMVQPSDFIKELKKQLKALKKMPYKDFLLS